MKESRASLVLFLAVVNACGTKTVFPTTTLHDATSVHYHPIEKRVLLLIPEDFAIYQFTTPSGNYAFKVGPRSTELLPDVLRQAFSTVEARTVSGEGALLVATDPRNAELQSYDYVAIPRFADTKVTRRGGMAGVTGAIAGVAAEQLETTIRIEFVSVDRTRSVAALGHGVGTGRWQADGTQIESPQSQMLRTAFINLIGDLNAKRGHF